MSSRSPSFTVIVPLTPVAVAKSRLVPASASASQHATLVEAIRHDTLSAVAAAHRVRRLMIVAPAGFGVPSRSAVLVPDPGDGLNAAVRAAAQRAARWWPHDGVAAVVGDLPALRADALDAVLAQVRDRLGFVADHVGSGTAMLVAPAGAELTPRFGEGSAARHAELAVPLEADARARADVDTPADLDVAATLGLGAHTERVLDGRRPVP